MKRNTSKNMSREQIIASMAKKLAENSSSEIIIKKKLSDKSIYFIAAAVLLAIVSIGTAISFNNKSTVQQSQEPEKVSRIDNPVAKLKNACDDKLINENQYAIYLKDLLIRYDSLPEKYKVTSPVISDIEVFDELSAIWPDLSYNIRLELINAIPDVEKRILAE
ncbi:MAG TPA: hypothetical protein VKY57_09755 [Chitinispirillaceae bacterium]|nr:hypothetical protein [Chitinispirillaceae bacterium]